MTKEQATIEYHELICGALDTPRMEGEVHHIVPRSCGGLDCDTNLVRLTCQEHFKAHELLPFIYDKGREHKAMVNAWWIMSHTRDGVEIDSEQYSSLKHEFRLQMVNRQVSDETKAKLSESHLGKPSPRKGVRTKESTKMILRQYEPWNKGRHLSEEDKAKKRESALNRVTPEFRQHMREIALRRVANGTHNLLKHNRRRKTAQPIDCNQNAVNQTLTKKD